MRPKWRGNPFRITAQKISCLLSRKERCMVQQAGGRGGVAKECIIMDKVLIYFRAELIKSSLMHEICIKITF